MDCKNLTNKKIIGIGVDIIEIDRFENSINNKRFLDKVFGKEEQEVLKTKTTKSYAGNFAVKEAFVKALGCGFVNVKPNEIEVLRTEKNQPYIKKNIKVKSLLGEVNGQFIHVSISHDKEKAMAFCIIESK